MARNSTAHNTAIVQYIIQQLNKGLRTSEIVPMVTAQYSMAERTAWNRITEAKNQIAEICSNTASEYRKTWIGRIEQQWRDSYDIDETRYRLQAQKGITELAARFTGADQVNNQRYVNIFNFYPGRADNALDTTTDTTIIDITPSALESEQGTDA